ncbi:MAG: hypothetical protein R2706_18820 [Acidimicrobiales bacterium]
MSLYKRLNENTGPAATKSGPDPALDALRHRVHTSLIEELGPLLYDKRLSEEDLRKKGLWPCGVPLRWSGRHLRPPTRSPADPGRLRRHQQLWPNRQVAAGRQRLGNHVQRSKQVMSSEAAS